MKRIPVLILIIVVVAINGIAQKSNLSSDLQSLVDNERAFARAASEKGVRDSFLAFIAEDGILYRPGPVNGKKWLTDRPSRPGLLSWQPVYADISSSGDLGFTTGPWEFRPNSPEDAPVAFGQFASVWQRQADSLWKFVIDIGTSHDKHLAAATAWQLPVKFNRKKVRSKGIDDLNAMLMIVDEGFSKASIATGTSKAYSEFVAEDVRLLRNGSFPLIGKKNALAFLGVHPGSLSWEPTKARVAGSGDLGYTYGNYQFKVGGSVAEIEYGNYMRVWKRQSRGGWKVVLEVFNELPKPAAN